MRPKYPDIYHKRNILAGDIIVNVRLGGEDKIRANPGGHISI